MLILVDLHANILSMKISSKYFNNLKNMMNEQSCKVLLSERKEKNCNLEGRKG